MPVINPLDVVVSPAEMVKIGASLLMTNAYIIMRHFGESAVERGVHGILGHEGPVMCDSGGFQILRYGEIDVSDEEMVRYQESIAPDIATILDVPTGIDVSRERAEWTVRETLRRARRAVAIRSNPDVLWCGPVQGGLFTDLVVESAREIGKMEYHVHAVGSPVELMEGYRFAELVDLVMAAKLNLPPDRPVHLFGAGHPMMLSLAVLMGCDLFDSAAYALYARDGRYMTVDGTYMLDDLRELPCACPVCSSTSPEELRSSPSVERTRLLALHNLHVTFAELRAIRQAISEGSLWELVQRRCTAHPRLLGGLRRLMGHSVAIEEFDPVSKRSAFFYLGEESARRPEVTRHSRLFRERYEPEPRRTLLLLPCFEFERVSPLDPENTHLVRVMPVFGAVPEELEEIYPLSQFQVPDQPDDQALRTAAESLRDYLTRFGDRYDEIVLLNDDRWGDLLLRACAPVEKKLRVREGGENFFRKT
jgi:7-cyano-7-deazaguanine tRNA-ribosyltransferase